MWKLIKKYILMEDIRQISLVSHYCYLLAFTIPTIIFGTIAIFLTVETFAYDFNKLSPLTGVVHVESDNIIYKKSGTIKPVINLNVISGNKKISYQIKLIESSDQIFQQQNKINNQLVKVWYLPQNDQFYLINFYDSSLNQLDFAKLTKVQLFNQVFYFKYIFPELATLALLIIMSFQLYAIRNFIFIRIINAKEPCFNLVKSILCFIIFGLLYIGTPIVTIFALKGLAALEQLFI